MTTGKRRRFFSFLKNAKPQRRFIWLQFSFLTMLMLFLLYRSIQLIREFSILLGSASQGIITAQELGLRIRDFNFTFAWQTASIFIVFFLIYMFLSAVFLHRSTGPLVRVRNVLNQISSGELPQGTVKFRKGDLIPEIALALNQMVHFCRRSKGSS